MDDARESLWSHFDLNDHITDLRQDDPQSLPGQGELWAFALPPPGIEEPNLHPWKGLTHLAPVAVPVLHLYTRQLELAARESMDPFHAFLQLMGIALPRRFIGMLWHGTAQQIGGSP